MNVITPAPLEPTRLPGIQHVTLAGQADGLGQLSVWRQRIAAGSATPPHVHDCEEVVLIESGQGELHVAGRVQPFHAGQTLVVPAEVPHQIVNTGPGELACTAIFSATPVGTRFPDGAPIDLPWRS